MKIKQRLYALKYYTEAGDLKTPPLLFYLLLFLSRTWILLVLSLASSQTGTDILQLLYPDKTHFYSGLLIGLLPVIIFIVSGRRHAQDSWALKCWPYCFYLLLISIIGDLSLQIYYLYLDNFQYSISASLQLVIGLWSCLYITKSKHLIDSFQKIRKED